jgi:hypothetical protein
MITFTGKYVNIWGYRVLRSTTKKIPEIVITVNGITTVWDILVITDLTILATIPYRA